MNEILNRLPAPTWNWTGTNRAPDAAALPTRPAGGWGEAGAASSALPAGVTSPEQSSLGDLFPESGMGAEADRWLADNANLRQRFAVAGEADAPVVLRVTLDAAHPYALSHTTVDAAPGSRVTLVQLVQGDAEGGVSAALTQIRAGAGSLVRLIQVQLLGANARRWNAVAIRAGQGARVEQIRIELGGTLTVCGTRAALGESRAAFDLDAIYFGSGSEVLDFNDVAVHTGRDTLSEMRTNGVLAGRSDKILRGTIDFRRGAARSVGHESEDVLFLNPGVRNRTTPLILCGEELVEGQHAASLGRLDEAKLYYLRSRGLTLGQARRLMVDARFAPTVDKLPDEEMQAQVNGTITRRLDDYESAKI